MKIIVGTMEFEIGEPYTEGQTLGDVEAQHLNELRGQRIRGILTKRLAKMDLAPTAQKIAFAQQTIADLDADFELKAPSVAKPKRYTLQDEIYEVAREAALNYAGSAGLVLEGTSLEAEITRFTADIRVITEAERRFNARNSVVASALQMFGDE